MVKFNAIVLLFLVLNTSVVSASQNYEHYNVQRKMAAPGGILNVVNQIVGNMPTISPSPTASPTSSPVPSPSPSMTPTGNPTVTDTPTKRPSASPTSSPAPSPSPSMIPTASPSSSPTQSPSASPSDAPTQTPSLSPTTSIEPTSYPSKTPSQSPTDFPSLSPSESPTSKPSSSPSDNPTATPSASPSDYPSAPPTNHPTDMPSTTPSASPAPSASPSGIPSAAPTSAPSASPSAAPSKSSVPSGAPTLSLMPSAEPSFMPSGKPSMVPSFYPTVSPTPESVVLISSVNVTLPNIERLMEGADMQIFDNVAQAFITEYMPSHAIVKVVIDRVDVYEQKLLSNRRSLTDAVNPERRAQNNDTQLTQLRVNMRVTGEVFPYNPPDDFSFDYVANYAFANNFMDFLSALSEASSFFNPAITGQFGKNNDISQIIGDNASPKKSVTTGGAVVIVVSAVCALALAIVASVISIRRRRDEQSLNQSENFEIDPRFGFNLDGIDDSNTTVLTDRERYALRNPDIETGKKGRYLVEGEGGDASTQLDTAMATGPKNSRNRRPEKEVGSLDLSENSGRSSVSQNKNALFDTVLSVDDDDTVKTNTDVACCGAEVLGDNKVRRLKAAVKATRMKEQSNASYDILKTKEFATTNRQSNRSKRGGKLSSRRKLEIDLNIDSNKPTLEHESGTPSSVSTSGTTPGGTLGARKMGTNEEAQYNEEAANGRRIGLYDVFAPPGPLGIVVDTTPDGPIVHSMKPTSSLLGLVSPGDLVVGLDDMDTRAMSAATLTRLMAKRATMTERKITLLAAAT